MGKEERRAGILNKRLTRRELLKGAGGAGLALGLGALAGCAPPAPAPAPAPPPAAPAEVGPTVIKVYVNANFFIEPDAFTEAQVWTVHVPEFNKARKDIQIIVEPVSRDEYTPKVLMMAASGDIGDVLWGTGSIPMWAKNDVLLPLDDLIAEDNFDLSVYDPTALKILQFDPTTNKWYVGPLWGLPNTFNAGVQMLYWNADIFKAAGVELPTEDTTYDDILEMAKRLTQDIDGDGTPDVWGFLPSPYHAHGIFWDGSMIAPFGGEIFNFEGTEARINSPESVAAFQWLYDLERKYQVAPPKDVVSALGGYKEMHMKSKLALYRNGPWGGMHFRLIPPEGEEGHVEAGGVPTPVGPSGSRGTFASCEWWGIAKASKHPKEAFEALKWITDYDSNKYRALGALVTPAYLAVREDPEILADPLLVINMKATEYAELPYHAANGRDSEINTLLGQELGGLDAGEQEPTQAFFDQLAAKIQDILDQPPA